MPKRTTKKWHKEYQNHDVAHQQSLNLLLGATAKVYKKHLPSPAQEIDVRAALGRSHAVNTPFPGTQKGPVFSFKGKTVLSKRAKASAMTTTTFITRVTITHQQSSNDSSPFSCHVKPASCFACPATVSCFHKHYLKLTSHSGVPCKHSYRKRRVQKRRGRCASMAGFLRHTYCTPKCGLTPLRSHKLREQPGWAAAQLCPTPFWETGGSGLAEGSKQHLVK